MNKMALTSLKVLKIIFDKEYDIWSPGIPMSFRMLRHHLLEYDKINVSSQYLTFICDQLVLDGYFEKITCKPTIFYRFKKKFLKILKRLKNG